jgi:hypothetical protein
VGVGAGVGAGVGGSVGAGVGGSVGAGVGVGVGAPVDGSTLADAPAEGLGVGHGSKTRLADGSADGTTNDGITPLASAVGTG